MNTDLSGHVGNVMPAIIEAGDRDPEMAYLLDRIGSERERGVPHHRRASARTRGESPGDRRLGLEALIGVTVGPIVFQKIVRRPQAHPRVRRRLPRRRHRRPHRTFTCVRRSGEDRCHRLIWGRSLSGPRCIFPRLTIDAGDRGALAPPDTNTEMGPTELFVAGGTRPAARLAEVGGYSPAVQRDRLAANHLQGPVKFMHRVGPPPPSGDAYSSTSRMQGGDRFTAPGRQDVARRIGEPGDRRPFGTAAMPLAILAESVVTLERHRGWSARRRPHRCRPRGS